jgi:hypothetical protein
MFWRNMLPPSSASKNMAWKKKKQVLYLLPAFMQVFCMAYFFDPEDVSGLLPPKRQLTSNRLHGVISQMIENNIKIDVHSDVE